MNEILSAYYFIIPSFISILFLGLLFLNRKRVYAKSNWKWFWISMTAFFGIYFLIIGRAAYSHLSAQWELKQYDLNNDGFFTENEQAYELTQRRRKLIFDSERKTLIISGLFFSGICSLLILIGGEAREYFNSKKKYNFIQSDYKNGKLINFKISVEIITILLFLFFASLIYMPLIFEGLYWGPFLLLILGANSIIGILVNISKRKVRKNPYKLLFFHFMILMAAALITIVGYATIEVIMSVMAEFLKILLQSIGEAMISE